MRRQFELFACNERGAIAILFAFSLTLICVCVGGAIDFARYNSARTQTTAAIDAAVLAGARVLLLGGTSTAAEAAAQEYYAKNIVDRFEVINDNVSFNVAENNTSITGSGNALLPTTLLKLAGIETLPLVDTSGSQFPKAQINGGGGGNIEVSVMIDVTGSMCDDGKGPCTFGTKMDAMKSAVKDLINIVVLPEQSTYSTRVALVPFSSRVRVAADGAGASIMKKLTNMDGTHSGWKNVCTSQSLVGTSGESQNWVCDTYEVQYKANQLIRPCVTERFYEAGQVMDYTDDVPGTNAWMNATSGRRFPISRDSASTPYTSGLGQTEADPSAQYDYGDVGSCWSSNDNVVRPLSADKNALMSATDNLTGEYETAGALGTAFAWYMLSPNWASIWPNESAPDSYSKLTQMQSNGKPKLRKVAVLMTDGGYNTIRSWSGQEQQATSDHAKQYCAAMKAKGIEIYTVGFDLDSLPSNERAIALDTLQSCGTDLDHFYNTLDPAELQTAFRDIAVKLSSISLTQ